MRTPPHHQHGASLLEVLVTILILSFGMLSLSGMLAFAVQLPKLSAYRATAVALASSQVERMRANTEGFKADAYKNISSYPQNSAPTGTECAYPNCDAANIASADILATNKLLFDQLPRGGMRVKCESDDCTLMQGDIWVMWDEPSTFAAIANSNDECPSGVDFGAGNAPRCIHIKFKL